MLGSVLKFQFRVNAEALELNLDGISDEEAVVQPSGGGNCVNCGGSQAFHCGGRGDETGV